VQKIGFKLFQVLYNFFILDSNRYELLQEESLLQSLSRVITSKSWSVAVKRKAVSVLALFAFFPQFGLFLERSRLYAELIPALVLLSADQTESLRDGPSLDLLAFILYQNLVHGHVAHILSVFLDVATSALCSAFAGALESCLDSIDTCISASRVVHVIASYQAPSDMAMWKKQFDALGVQGKLLRLLRSSTNESFIESGMLAVGSLAGAPPFFSWEIPRFAQLPHGATSFEAMLMQR